MILKIILWSGLLSRIVRSHFDTCIVLRVRKIRYIPTSFGNSPYHVKFGFRRHWSFYEMAPWKMYGNSSMLWGKKTIGQTVSLYGILENDSENVFIIVVKIPREIPSISIEFCLRSIFFNQFSIRLWGLLQFTPQQNDSLRLIWLKLVRWARFVIVTRIHSSRTDTILFPVSLHNASITMEV